MWSPSLVLAAVLLMRAVLVVTTRSESCNVTQVYNLNTLHQMQQFGNHDATGTGDVTCAGNLRELSALQGVMRNISERQIQILKQVTQTHSNATLECLQTAYRSTASDLKKVASAMNNQFVLLSARLDAMENATSSALDSRKTASDLSKLSDTINNQFVQLSQRLDAMQNTTSSALDSQKTASDLNKLSDAINNQFVQLSQRLNVMENASASTTESLLQVYDMLKFLMDAQNRTEQSFATTKNVTDASVGHPTDCEEVFLKGHRLSGVYSIWPQGSPRSVRVYCEMGTKKWTVIMKRFDGSVSFEETWDRYKWGFGTATGEYWLGLEYMYLLTKQRDMKLRFDMTEWETGSSYQADFFPFTIGNSSQNYRIHVVGHSGATTNRFTITNGKQFTAKDNDNDSSSINCAVKERGGWWHGDCSDALPTGPYRRSCSDDICMTWRYAVALNRVTMKLARV